MATAERWKLFQQSCRTELDRRLPEFNGLRSNEERAKFCLQLDCWEGDTLSQLTHKLHSLQGMVGKSADRANQLRDRGNAAYKAHNFQEAFTLYTDSISYSPVLQSGESKRTDCLSLALANRSAVLFHLQEYKLCLQDILASLAAGYPINLQYKLLHRKVLVLFKLGRNEDGKKEIKEALKAIESADIPDSRKEVLGKELKAAGRNVTKQEENKEERSTEEVKVPELQCGESQQVVHVSAGVEMRRHPDKGRMLVAQKAFEPGSVLIVEQPYAAVLLQKHHSTHCHTCITPVQLPLPCRGCQFIQYCSTTCEEQAWQEHHRHECPRWHLLQMVDTFTQLSLRLLLSAATRGEKIPTAIPSSISDKPLEETRSSAISADSTTEEVNAAHTESGNSLDQLNSLSSDNNTVDSSSCLTPELYRGDYSSVHNLMPHTENCSVEHLLTQTMVACLVCKCLGSALCEDVVKRLVVSGGDCVVQMAGLLCRHMQQLRCNAQAITTLQEQDSVSLLEDKQVRLATAVFPTEALLNHSCRPNVFVSFQGRTLVVRAVSDIKEGDELLHCYGPHAGRMGRQARQAALKEQYFFSCRCEACQEEEGSHNTVDIFSAYKCPNCSKAAKLQDNKLFCSSDNCNSQANVAEIQTISKKIQDLFVQSSGRIDDGQVEEAVSGLKQCLVLQWKILHPNNKDIARTHDALARSYATTGDCQKSVEHLKKSLSTVELQFGACSVELAHELHKLAQLQFNGQQVAECLATIERSLTIFGCHYGEHHPKMKELHAMKDCLINVLV